MQGKKNRSLERLRAGEEGIDKGWDGWMASPTQWTWIWANWGRWRRTGEPGTLHSLRSQRDGLDRATEQQLSSASSLLGFCLGINISLVISVNKGCSRKRLLSTAVPPNSVPWGEFKERKTGWCPEGVKMHIISMTSKVQILTSFHREKHEKELLWGSGG